MKTTKILLAFLFVFTAHLLHAQDTLVKVNHDRMVVKVLEVDPEVVKYKLFSSPDGPLYVVKKDDIRKIIYADGHEEVFSNYDNPTVVVNMMDYYNKWLVGINIFDVVATQLTGDVDYSLNENTSLNFKLSFGLNYLAGKKPENTFRSPYYYNKDKRFSMGVGMLFYPNGKMRKANYYLGPYMEYGETGYMNYYSYPYPYPPYTKTYGIEWYSGVGITDGVLIFPANNLFISMYGTFGVMRTGNSSYNDFNVLGRMGMTIGFAGGKTKPLDDNQK